MPTTIERAAAPIKPHPGAVDHIVDLCHPALTPLDALLLDRLQKLRASYMQHGRGREAHAVARATLVAWHTILKMAGTDHMTATMPAPLDVALP